MQKYIKAGVLIVILVVPVFIFLFLKGFSTNRFDIPYFIPQRDSLTQGVMIDNGDTVFFQLPNFSTNTIDGERFAAEQIKGKIVVVSAQESPCEDTCQKVMAQLGRVAGLSEVYPELLILTLVRGKVKAYRQEVTDSDRWRFVPLPETLYPEYLGKVFHLNESLGGQQTILPHNRFQLIDQSGFVRGYYDALDPEETDRLMVEIKILERNRKEEEIK
jgi:protein SCO1